MTKRLGSAPFLHREDARASMKWVAEGLHPEKHATLAIMHMMAAEMEERFLEKDESTRERILQVEEDDRSFARRNTKWVCGHLIEGHDCKGDLDWREVPL